MKTQETVYSKAADLIERTGWTQGAFAADALGPVALGYRGATCFCLEGALVRAGTRFVGDPWLNEKMQEVGWWRGTIEWNDAPNRTKEQVIRMLRAAHDLKLSGEQP